MVLDTLRYIFVFLGLIIIGFNLSALAHAPRLVYHANAWRVYLIGSTGLVIYICASIYSAITHSFGLTWRLPLGGASFSIILISSVMLYLSSKNSQEFKP